MPDVPLLVLAGIAVAAGASVQVAIGFGFALVAAPVLVALDPTFAPGPTIAIGVALSAWTFLRERSAVDLPGLRWAWAGRVPGTAAGAAVLALVPPRRTAIVVAIVILLAVSVSLLRWRPRPTPGTVFTAGVLSGAMGTAASVGGPPLALVYQSATGPQLRSAMSGSLVVGGAVSIAALAAAGRFGAAEVRAVGLLAVPAFVGALSAPLLAGHVDRGGARIAVLVLSGCSAVLILVRELL